MHLLDSKNGEAARHAATIEPPFGGGFDVETVHTADRLEVWGSDFSESGPDHCEFRLIREGETIATRTVRGY